jgi:hypothetical protein
MKRLVLLVALMCVAVSGAQGQDVYQWFGASSSNWADPGNWNTEVGPIPGFGTCPGPYDKVKLNNVLWDGIYFPVIGGENGTQDIPIGDIFMVDAGWLSPASLTVAANGSLLVQGATDNPGDAQINIAYAPLGTASLIIDGGVVTVDGVIHVGWGGTGQVQIGNDSSLILDTIDFDGAGGYGDLLFTGFGEMIVKSVPEFVILDLIVGDKIWTNVPGAYVTASYNEELDQVRVYIIPEPISISLLGLGALLLRRRS